MTPIQRIEEAARKAALTIINSRDDFCIGKTPPYYGADQAQAELLRFLSDSLEVLEVRQALEGALASIMATGTRPDGTWTVNFTKFKAAEFDHVRPAIERLRSLERHAAQGREGQP